MIDTSRGAEKIIIRSHDEKVISEWKYKYEQVYAEIHSWREKASWYESEHSRYIHEIQLLKQNLEQSEIRFRAELEKQIRVAREEEGCRYQAEINQLREFINRQKNESSQTNIYVNQINSLKVEIQNYQVNISNLNIEINKYKQTINNLQVELNGLRNQPKPNVHEYQVQINNLQQQIGRLNAEIAGLRNRPVSN